MLDDIKPYVEKTLIDGELTGHAHKLDVKLQSFCGSGFSLFAVRMCQALPLSLWSELTNNTLRKQRWDTFLYPQF